MILWHIFFKRSLYEILERVDSESIKLSTEYEIIKSPIKIDAVLEVKDESKLHLLGSIFSHGQKVNLIEYKSIWEIFNASFYRKVNGYGFFYAYQNDISEKELAEFIFVSKIDKTLFDIYGFRKLDNGLYERKGELLIYVIVINELDIKEENYPFLRFSTGKTFEKYLNSIVKEKSLSEIKFCYILYPDEVKEVMNMQGVEIPLEQLTLLDALRRIGIKNALPPTQIKELAEEYGLKEMIDAIGIKTVIEEFGIEKVIEEVGIEKVIEEVGIEKVIEEIGIENVIKHVGIKTVIDKIGVKAVINEIGTDAVIKELGIETVIKGIGIEKIKKEIEKMENNRKK